jgi:hypothetical protein
LISELCLLAASADTVVLEPCSWRGVSLSITGLPYLLCSPLVVPRACCRISE